MIKSPLFAYIGLNIIIVAVIVLASLYFAGKVNYKDFIPSFESKGEGGSFFFSKSGAKQAAVGLFWLGFIVFIILVLAKNVMVAAKEY